MKRNFQDFDIGERLCCPITKELMEDPVTASDGHVYERKAIEKHLKSSKTSPMTRSQLSETLTVNQTIKGLISEYKQNIQTDSSSTSSQTDKKRKTDDNFVFNYEYIENRSRGEKERQKKWQSIMWANKQKFIFQLKKLYHENAYEYELNVNASSEHLIDISGFENTFKYEDKSLLKLCTNKISEVKNVTGLLKNALLNKIHKDQLIDLYPSFSDIVRDAFNSQQALFLILLCKIDNDNDNRNVILSDRCILCGGFSTTSLHCCDNVICRYCLSQAELKENLVEYNESDYWKGSLREDVTQTFRCPSCSTLIEQHSRDD